jgi:hypothetical protein
MIVNDKVTAQGTSVAVFYSPKPFGHAYGGGFTRGSGKGGVITGAENRLIKTIDNRPAAEVYDEWLGGRLSDAKKAGRDVKALTGFYPLVRTLNGPGGVTTDQFTQAWPSYEPSEQGSLVTAASVAVGERLYTSEGTWNILLNRFAAMPRQAKASVKNITPVGGLFLYCGGALETIPRDNRGNMGYLVGKSMGDLPWIGVFSWGEQTNVEHIGNLQGNLSSVTLLFPSTAPSVASVN